MDTAKALELLGFLGAVITDSHIVYTSGKHGSSYVNKDALYPHTEHTKAFALAIASYFIEDGVEAVIGPALGGVILAHVTANQLQSQLKSPVLGVYAEKADTDEGFVIKRGFDKLIQGKRVLVVEDILTTGGSALKVINSTRSVGANVIGLGALCNRGGITAAQLGVPKFHAIVDVAMSAWDEHECPLCQSGVPINTDVGKGREYLARLASGTN